MQLSSSDESAADRGAHEEGLEPRIAQEIFQYLYDTSGRPWGLSPEERYAQFESVMHKGDIFAQARVLRDLLRSGASTFRELEIAFALCDCVFGALAKPMDIDVTALRDGAFARHGFVLRG